MRVMTIRLLEEQIAVVIVLESGKKDDAMWHVPQWHWQGPLARPTGKVALARWL